MEGCGTKYKFKTHFIDHVRKMHGRRLLSKKENSILNMFLKIHNLNTLYINTLNELENTDKYKLEALYDLKIEILYDINDRISDNSNTCLRKVKRMFELYFFKT